MSDILDIVRSRIGQRHKISRREMADLLAELSSHGLDLRNGYLGMTLAGNNYDSPQAPNAHEVWANACREITCISVDTRGLRDGYVRFDDPGSMHPDQHAELLFAPAELANYEYDQIGQMRRHADRVLIVDGPAIEPPAEPAKLAQGVAHLRKLEWVDGVFIRVDDDGMLEMRDPNDGQSPDPADKARHQYRVDEAANVWYRRLPPESVGEAWLDAGVPEWERHETPPTADLIYRWWEERVM